MRGRTAIFWAYLFISSCAITAILGPPAFDEALVAYVKRLAVETSHPWDFPEIAGRAEDSIWEAAGHRTFRIWWCPNHKVVRSEKDVREKIGSFCRGKGGVQRGALCRNPIKDNAILFYAEVVGGQECDGYSMADVLIIEPIGDTGDPDYVRALKMQGYMTREQAAAFSGKAKP